jgi:hypothetical protein
MESAKAHALITSLRTDQDRAILLAVTAQDRRLMKLYSDLYEAAAMMIAKLERDIDNGYQETIL